MKLRFLPLFFLIITTFACKQATSEKIVKPFVLKHQVRQPLRMTPNPPALILLHGYGSNDADLFGLAKHIPDEWLVIAAQAPHQMGDNKFAWYPLDFSSGKAVGQANEAAKAHQTLKEFITQVTNQYKLNPKRIVLGGFSQGAILSVSLAMDANIQVKGAAAFSGRLIEGSQVQYENTDFSKQNIFMSHGENDPVIPFNKALEMKAFLEHNGAKVQFVSDDAKHTISNVHFSEFLKWMKQL